MGLNEIDLAYFQFIINNADINLKKKPKAYNQKNTLKVSNDNINSTPFFPKYDITDPTPPMEFLGNFEI